MSLVGGKPEWGSPTHVIVLVAAVAVLVDWVSKVAMSAMLDDGPMALGRLLTLRLGHNPGIAFGLGDQLPSPVVLALTAAVTTALAYSLIRGLLPSPVGGGLILGGAIGNLGDRVVGGSVVDFIDLGWWPSFNLADAFLTIGVGWSMVVSLREPERSAADVSPPRGDKARRSSP